MHYYSFSSCRMKYFGISYDVAEAVRRTLELDAYFLSRWELQDRCCISLIETWVFVVSTPDMAEYSSTSHVTVVPLVSSWWTMGSALRITRLMNCRYEPTICTIHGRVSMRFLVAPMLSCPQGDTMIAFSYSKTLEPDQCELETQASPEEYCTHRTYLCTYLNATLMHMP